MERNAEQTLALLSPRLYSVGTGEDEMAIGREAFAELLRAELEQLPDTISYSMDAYHGNERVPGCWDCVCRIETRMPLPDNGQAVYRMRVTAGLHWDGNRYVIDILHASEASRYQEEGEFFPLKFISGGMGALGPETQHQLMELIEQTMPGGIVGSYMEEGFPLYAANERLLSMAGYGSYQEFQVDVQGLFINIVHPEDRTYVSEAIGEALASGDQYEIQYRMKKKDGSYLWVLDIGRRTVAADKRDAVICLLIDISQQVRDRSYLEHEALSDPLTGVYNRKGGQVHIDSSMKCAAGYLFFMLDLDHFKRVNDFYGHRQGDEALCLVASKLMSSFRKTDIICRLGGDEFSVFISSCQNIDTIRCKIQQLIDDYQQTAQCRWPASRSTLSVGGICGTQRRTFEELYQLADEVLYEVKNTQKGCQKFRILE